MGDDNKSIEEQLKAAEQRGRDEIIKKVLSGGVESIGGGGGGGSSPGKGGGMDLSQVKTPEDVVKLYRSCKTRAEKEKILKAVATM